jgi:hypothetical protein
MGQKVASLLYVGRSEIGGELSLVNVCQFAISGPLSILILHIVDQPVVDDTRP